jgi:hypothetical protein
VAAERLLCDVSVALLFSIIAGERDHALVLVSRDNAVCEGSENEKE